MRFLILRLLTQSELGWFGAWRRAGKETSRQRAVNFDGPVVDRIFPAAMDHEDIPIEFRYLTDAHSVEVPRALVDRLRAALATSADTGPARLVAEAIAGHAMEVAGTWYCVPTETLA